MAKQPKQKKSFSEKAHDLVDKVTHPHGHEQGGEVEWLQKPKRELPVGDIKGHAKFHKFKKGNE